MNECAFMFFVYLKASLKVFRKVEGVLKESGYSLMPCAAERAREASCTTKRREMLLFTVTQSLWFCY